MPSALSDESSEETSEDDESDDDSGQSDSGAADSPTPAMRDRKRQGVNVGVRAVSLALHEQSVLKDGYLLPANEDKEADEDIKDVVPDDVPPAPSAEDADAATPSAAGPVRRAAMMLRADVRPRRQSSEVQAQKEAQKKDPASSFDLSWEEDQDFPIALVQASLEPSQLEKAVLYYRSLPQAQSREYHCLVNLACCLMALNQPRQAKNLLEQATILKPSKASAQLNLIACCLRIRHRSSALSGIDQALRNAEDLTAEHHRLLLWTRRELLALLSKDPGTARPEGRSGRKEVKVETTRTRKAARYQVFTRLEAWQMRKDLLALRSGPSMEEGQELKPPWRRRHIYSEDSEQAIYSRKARWQPLSPDAMELLREACKKLCKCGKDDGALSDDSDIPEDTDTSSEEEVKEVQGSKAAQQAYECIKPLPCMQALASDKAIALIQAGELVDYDADTQIFEEGDPALHVYIIVRGSVSIRVMMPELGNDPIPVQSLYDGQVFGDAKIAAWKDANAPPPKRKGGARTQEDTCMLRIPAPAYRHALGLDTKTNGPNQTGGNTEGNDEEEGALLPEVRRKVQALLKSPLFQGAAASTLVLLATNLQEVSLRHDDVFMEIDQALQACFLISQGYVRVSVPAVDLEANLGPAYDDASRILGSGRLPHHGPALGVTSWKKKKREKKIGSDLLSRFNLSKGEVPVFQLGMRPLLMPTDSVSSSATPRPSRLITRLPGNPRRGSAWHQSLRRTQMVPYLGGTPSDIELCFLHAGQAFGLQTLLDKQDCSYVSSCEVRVQSSEAKILVLTPASLLYLNESLAQSLKDKVGSMDDPVRPSLQSIKRERLNRSHWAVRKQKVFYQVVMQED